MKKLISLLLCFFSLKAVAMNSPKDAYDMALKKKAVIIDVREKDEVASGMIEHAEWFPLSKIENEKNWKEDFKKITDGKKIFLYCRSGNRSGKVKDLLKAQGIDSENIGGYEALKSELPTKKQ